MNAPRGARQRLKVPVADNPPALLLMQLIDGLIDPTARTYAGLAHYCGCDPAVVQHRATGFRRVTPTFAQRVALAIGDRVKVDGQVLTARQIHERFTTALETPWDETKP